MMVEDQELKYLCRFCSKSFSSGNSLGGHMRGHLALINAEKCEESENGDLGFQREEKNVPLMSEMDLEDVGEASYGLRENPKKSWRISPSKHGGELKEMNFCKECGKGFPSLKAVAGHMRSHSTKGKQENAVCKECGKLFDSLRALFGHMRSHSKRSKASSESDYEVVCPVKKKRSTTRYSNVTSHSSISQSDSFVCFTEGDEVKEVAMCLMMLSRGASYRDELSLSIDTAKNCGSANLESWSSFRRKGSAGKQDDLRSECGDIEMRKMKKSIGNDIESTVSGFGNFGSCFDSDDEHKSGVDASDDQSRSCDKSKKTLDMKNSIISPIEAELMDLVTEVGVEEVDMGLQKANSCNKASVVDDQCKLNKIFSDDQLHCATSASEFSKDNERKGKFMCKICFKTFKTPQALGGHRTTHRTLYSRSTVKEESHRYVETDSELEKLKCNENPLETDDTKKSKEHECSICFKVFASGQALGGHKRAHYIGVPVSKGKAITLMEQDPLDHIDNNLDLNFPATAEEESSTGVSLNPWWGVDDFECEPVAIFN